MTAEAACRARRACGNAVSWRFVHDVVNLAKERLLIQFCRGAESAGRADER